jgi:hypothetical protein
VDTVGAPTHWIDPDDKPYVELVFCYPSECSLLLPFTLILDYLEKAGIISTGDVKEEISRDTRKRKASPTMLKDDFDTRNIQGNWRYILGLQ